MLNYAIGVLCSASLAFCVYTAGWGPAPVAHKPHATAAAAGDDCCEVTTPVSTTAGMKDCCAEEAKSAGLQPVLLLDVAMNTAATRPAATDAKNTKCIVVVEDAAGAKTVEHQGVAYKVCCAGCVATFNKDPEKFVKAFNADPAKYGVKK